MQTQPPWWQSSSRDVGGKQCRPVTGSLLTMGQVKVAVQFQSLPHTAEPFYCSMDVWKFKRCRGSV